MTEIVEYALVLVLVVVVVHEHEHGYDYEDEDEYVDVHDCGEPRGMRSGYGSKTQERGAPVEACAEGEKAH